MIIVDLWYTLRGELDKESKNLIKEATGHKVDNLVELSEIGMSIYAGKVASKKITGKLGEESEKLSGLLKKTRKPASVVTRAKRLVKKFMPKKRYRKFKVVDIEELSKKQCLKPNIQLFAEDGMKTSCKTNTIKLYRVMSEAEYDSVISNGKFLPYSKAMEEKWFATTKSDASKWGNIFYPDGKYKMVEVDIDESYLSKMYKSQYLDGIGPAYCSSLKILEDAIVSIKGLK